MCGFLCYASVAISLVVGGLAQGKFRRHDTLDDRVDVPYVTASRAEYEYGYGPTCYGVWTSQWQEHNPIPQDLKNQLKVYNPELLELIQQQKCPYGIALPGQVTWPRSISAFQVVAVLYSYFPWVMAAGTIVYTAWEIKKNKRIGTVQLNVLTWLLLAIIVQEVVAKPLFRQPRPGTMMQVKDYEGRYAGSCISTCGMPSSHSMLATGWFMILLVDRMSRVESFLPNASSRFVSTWEHLKRPMGYLSRSLLPWMADNKTMTKQEFAWHVAVWFGLLMPVPWMRVVLYDHSVKQAMSGTFAGLALALLWWRMVRLLQRCMREEENQMLLDIRCFRIKHDFVLERTSYRVAALPIVGNWEITEHIHIPQWKGQFFRIKEIEDDPSMLAVEGYPYDGEQMSVLAITGEACFFLLRQHSFEWRVQEPSALNSKSLSGIQFRKVTESAQTGGSATASRNHTLAQPMLSVAS